MHHLLYKESDDMVTRLEEVYRLFLSDIEDEDWLLVEEEVIEDLLLAYLEKATVDFDVCRKDLTINYDNLTFNDELELNERVILSKAMLLHYLSPKIVREEKLGILFLNIICLKQNTNQRKYIVFQKTLG